MTDQSRNGRQRAALLVEALLVIFGAACISYCAYAGIQAHAAQIETHMPAARTGPASPTKEKSDVIGRIEIPGLGITAPITPGIENIELIRGVGHVPGTAFPGGLGTMGLAGHRDTFFRGLRRIGPGMVIVIKVSEGTYFYKTDSSEIVTPEETEVLDIGDRPELVLVTCYPFTYVGAAPRRFIVHAHLISAAAA